MAMAADPLGLSPGVADNKVLGAIANPSAFNTTIANSDINYYMDLGTWTYNVRLPSGYDPSNPSKKYGLVTWIDAGGGNVFPSSYAAALDAHDIIWLSGHNIGNSVTTAYRLGVAVLGAFRMTELARCAVIGIGGLGHIGVQCLRAMSGAEIIAVDVSDEALQMAARMGADHVVKAGDDAALQVRELTGGRGVEVVLDFVGELGTTAQGPAMLAVGGTYFVIGYGGRVDLPAIEIISREISVVGSLVGSFTELAELMALAAQGKVKLETREYGLEEVNVALAQLRDGHLHGRGVLVPT